MPKNITILITVFIFLILISSSFAQTNDPDKDNLVGRADLCPTVWGPRSNNGCPLAPDATALPDADGDGNPDYADQCPNAGGPASNAGCPEDETPNEPVPTEDVLPPLPILPESGRCYLATQGRERVNVRDIPALAGAIVGQLDPMSIYPVHAHILGAVPEDSWYLIDLGWVSATVVRLGGNCRQIPSIQLPETFIIHLGDLALIFVGDENFDPANIPAPDEEGELPLPPFLLQSCDGSVRMSWLLQDFQFCDGSVMPTDQLPNEDDGSAFECDGAFNFFDVFIGQDDVSLAGILIGLLLPAVKMGDGSVIPSDSFFGDGSVMPCNDKVLFAHGTGGGGGAGKVQFQDFHFIALMDKSGNYGVLMLALPQERGVGDPFVPFALNFGVEPPDEAEWTQVNGILIGLLQGTSYFCPAAVMGDGSVRTGIEAVGFDPQPDPPASCMSVNFANE